VERIYLFLPSILFITCIAGITHLYIRLVIKRFGDNFKSVEWHEKNERKVSWMLGTPTNNVLAPAMEELIFRAPLIIAFSAMSSVAWYGIFASSGIFALMHWLGKKIWMPDILSARENSDHKTDDMVVEVNRLHQEKGREIMVRKVLHVILMLPLGILTGYYGIKYQSIWVAFGIHSIWNLIMPIVLLIFMFLVMFALAGILFLWNKVKWKQKKLW